MAADDAEKILNIIMQFKFCFTVNVATRNPISTSFLSKSKVLILAHLEWKVKTCQACSKKKKPELIEGGHVVVSFTFAKMRKGFLFQFDLYLTRFNNLFSVLTVKTQIH